MKKKMVGVFVVTLLLVATSIVVAGNMNQASNSSDMNLGATGLYNPAGGWMREDYFCICNIIPAGVGRYTIISEYLHSPTWNGMFPNAVENTLERGEMVWKGWNTYDYTFFEYGVNINYEVEYYILTSGTFKMTSSNTGKTSMCISLFTGDQDPFSDTPFACIPYETTYERIPVVPPCEP